MIGIILPLIILTYDIACQWSKNFRKRMEGFRTDMKLGPGTEIRTAIPSWHINGHSQACRQNFCLGYMKGAGRTCGEEVETSWSNTNSLAPSTREMGPAARHETLNNHWSGWNFRKIVGLRMVTFLYNSVVSSLLPRNIIATEVQGSSENEDKT